MPFLRLTCPRCAHSFTEFVTYRKQHVPCPRCTERDLQAQRDLRNRGEPPAYTFDTTDALDTHTGIMSTYPVFVTANGGRSWGGD